jgi:hypothetical protein
MSKEPVRASVDTSFEDIVSLMESRNNGAKE